MRFPPGLWEYIRMKFPASPLLRGEFFLAPDGKIKYYRPHRLRIYRELYGMVAERFPESIIELSMEDRSVWTDAGIALTSE
jgi:spore photoproduct lyase